MSQDKQNYCLPNCPLRHLHHTPTSPKTTGICSAHQNGEDITCKVCYLSKTEEEINKVLDMFCVAHNLSFLETIDLANNIKKLVDKAEAFGQQNGMKMVANDILEKITKTSMSQEEYEGIKNFIHNKYNL